MGAAASFGLPDLTCSPVLLGTAAPFRYALNNILWHLVAHKFHVIVICFCALRSTFRIIFFTKKLFIKSKCARCFCFIWFLIFSTQPRFALCINWAQLWGYSISLPLSLSFSLAVPYPVHNRVLVQQKQLLLFAASAA